ncbi:hypothetical protein [Methanosphaera sp.]|uniref:hypothetical protein n=1 Tax=Methanosphaera sp. TaxID=2666342 RepID=UPI0025E40D25|nr:hypothetical protein [Methanosphaera sp.]
MNNKGQIVAEYILVIGIIIVILITMSQILIEESEKNTILESAQIGAQIGIDKNAYAMYYNDTFNNYMLNYPKLLYPTEISVINISMMNNNRSIILQVFLHSDNYLTNNQKEIVGSRVNYYIRKTISETFNQKNSDLYYENCQTNNYKIETKKVKWI